MDAECLAIDPGYEESGFVWLYGKGITAKGIHKNADLKDILVSIAQKCPDLRFVIEKIVCYGRPVGQETLDTCIFIGRLVEALGEDRVTLMSRVEVKQRLCHQSTKIKDSILRQVLIDRYGPSKEKAIGTVKNPGPLHGVKSHEWAALALGVAYRESIK